MAETNLDFIILKMTTQANLDSFSLIVKRFRRPRQCAQQLRNILYLHVTDQVTVVKELYLSVKNIVSTD